MLSVVVVTKNEQELIKTCLESVSFADEIIVFDNGSTDKTLEIAKAYTNKIFKTDDSDFATLRNKAFKETKGDWILYVDADERILQPLKEEILKLIGAEKTAFSAFAISRKNIVFGSEQKYKAFWPDWVIRLLKRSDFESWIGKVHEYPRFKGELGYLKNSFLHLTHRNVDHFMSKLLEWSKIDAKLRFESNHPKMSSWRFFRILITETFNQGIKRGGFFAGTVGVIDSFLQSFSLLITYVRVWEMQQSPTLPEVYKKIDRELIKNNFNL